MHRRSLHTGSCRALRTHHLHCPGASTGQPCGQAGKYKACSNRIQPMVLVQRSVAGFIQCIRELKSWDVQF